VGLALSDHGLTGSNEDGVPHLTCRTLVPQQGVSGQVWPMVGWISLISPRWSGKRANSRQPTSHQQPTIVPILCTPCANSARRVSPSLAQFRPLHLNPAPRALMAVAIIPASIPILHHLISESRIPPLHNSYVIDPNPPSAYSFFTSRHKPASGPAMTAKILCSALAMEPEPS
jgi:hypothetical protein